VTKVLADILLVLDTDDLSMLTLLDLSAAFDIVDHQILIRRLETPWPWCCRVELVQVVPRRSYSIRPLWQIDLNSGCSYFQSSTGVGPRTDSVPALHSRPVATDRATQSTSTCIYADDTQIYGFCPPSAISVLQEQMSACLDAVALWIRSNRLQLNAAKTEVLWCATSLRQYQIPQAPVRVGEDLITPAASARDLGIYLESESGLRHLHEVTHLEDCVELLCCPSTDLQHTLLCPQAGDALFGRVAGFVMTRLRQCHTRRSTGVPDRSAAVRVERRRPAGLLITEVRPRDAASS